MLQKFGWLPQEFATLNFASFQERLWIVHLECYKTFDTFSWKIHENKAWTSSFVPANFPLKGWTSTNFICITFAQYCISFLAEYQIIFCMIFQVDCKMNHHHHKLYLPVPIKHRYHFSLCGCKVEMAYDKSYISTSCSIIFVIQAM